MPATTEWPWPEKGGSYIRDKTTGKLTRRAPAETGPAETSATAPEPPAPAPTQTKGKGKSDGVG